MNTELINTKRRALASLLVTGAVAGATAGRWDDAFAIDYLTPDKAQALLLPSASTFVQRGYKLSADQLAAVAKIGRVSSRSADWKIALGLDAQSNVVGAVVVDNVIGKYEMITYAVASDIAGVIKGIEILSYRESHGGEIRLPSWRKQFVGKTNKEPIQVGDDIALISGATLSSVNVTDGVRRISAVLEVLRDSWTKKAG